MNRWLWIVYLLCSFLILGSWLGWVASGPAWGAWVVATGISVASWSGVLRPRPKVPTGAFRDLLTEEERERARREMDGEDLS